MLAHKLAPMDDDGTVHGGLTLLHHSAGSKRDFPSAGSCSELLQRFGMANIEVLSLDLHLSPLCACVAVAQVHHSPSFAFQGM